MTVRGGVMAGVAEGRRVWLVLALAVGLLALPTPIRAGDEEVRVSVVVILASDKDATVDPRLECVAREVKKQRKDLNLVGFRLGTLNCKSIKVGHREEFPLVEGKSATVAVQHGTNADGRVRLRIKAPGVGEITYTTACGKYFPIVSGYKTTKGERLIVAVSVKPCPCPEEK